jgi:hypothetical protein
LLLLLWLMQKQASGWSDSWPSARRRSIPNRLFTRRSDSLDAATAEIHPGPVERFVAYGLLEPVEWIGPALLFDSAAVPRLHMILRLRRDTGVNLAGIGMILDLLDRLHTLERDNQWLRAQQ